MEWVSKMANDRTLWIVAARAGSKGIPNKNIKELGGLPLLAYKVKTARKIANSSDVWISTDSQYYADIASQFGASIPFIRPNELASDTASSADVVLDAINWAENRGIYYDMVGLLEPTSPFVPFQELKKATCILSSHSMANSIIAVRKVRPSSFYIQEQSEYLDKIAKNIDGINRTLRRQEELVEITPCGGFYIAKWDLFKEQKTFYTDRTLAYEVDEFAGLEIDEPIDFLWAQFLLENNIVNLNDLF